MENEEEATAFTKQDETIEKKVNLIEEVSE